MAKKISIVIFSLILISVGIFYSIGPIFQRYSAPVYFEPPFEISNEAYELHQQLWVIDAHSDVLLSGRKLLQRSKFGHTDIPRLIEGNVAIQGFTVVTRMNATTDLHNMPSDGLDLLVPLTTSLGWPSKTRNSPYQRALYQAEVFHQAVAESYGTFYAITSQESLKQYVEKKKVNPKITAGFLGIEGLHALEGELSHVDALYDAGYRMMAPVHFFDNKVGGSAHGTDKKGLTDFGQQVIERLDELSITIDLAHASEPLIDDVLQITDRPVLVSHTGVQGTCPSPRNLSDRHLKAIAAKGGVIGIGFFKMAICGGTVEDLVDAIKYVVALVGIDYVALGSDFDGATRVLFSVEHMAVITQALMDAGFDRKQISKIMGMNIQRVLLQNLPTDLN